MKKGRPPGQAAARFWVLGQGGGVLGLGWGLSLWRHSQVVFEKDGIMNEVRGDYGVDKEERPIAAWLLSR